MQHKFLTPDNNVLLILFPMTKTSEAKSGIPRKLMIKKSCLVTFIYMKNEYELEMNTLKVTQKFI